MRVLQAGDEGHARAGRDHGTGSDPDVTAVRDCKSSRVELVPATRLALAAPSALGGYGARPTAAERARAKRASRGRTWTVAERARAGPGGYPDRPGAGPPTPRLRRGGKRRDWTRALVPLRRRDLRRRIALLAMHQIGMIGHNSGISGTYGWRCWRIRSQSTRLPPPSRSQEVPR